MPKVIHLQGGQNVSAVMGLSDRTQSMIRRRNSLGLATYGPAYQWTDAGGAGVQNTWLAAPNLPPLTRCIGSSGAAWVMWGMYDAHSSTPGNAGITVDGALPPPVTTQAAVGFVNVGVPLNAFGSLAAAVTGLTPGWHSFNFATFSTNSFPITWVPTFFTVWPL